MASASVTMKVVVVADDTAFVRDRFRTAVENAGHKAIVVTSAAELLARVKAEGSAIDLIVLGIAIQFRFCRTIAAALTLKLRHGGIAIRTTSPLESKARIRVRFRMPGSKHDIDAEGLVAWSDRRVGMGVRFEKLDAAQQALIDNFVDAHFFSNRKA